jgi:hypothetical protein
MTRGEVAAARAAFSRLAAALEAEEKGEGHGRRSPPK